MNPLHDLMPVTTVLIHDSVTFLAMSCQYSMNRSGNVAVRGEAKVGKRATREQCCCSCDLASSNLTLREIFKNIA